MQQTPAPLDTSQKIIRLGAIALVVAALGGAFAYVNGTLDPQRLTPDKLVNNLERAGGVHAGFRRNHAKGICVSGYFESSGQLKALSQAKVFSDARTPLTGRFALPGPNPYAPDTSVSIRSFAVRFMQSDGEQWRTGMNSMPVFPIGTVEAFYAQQLASQPDPATGKPNPDSMKQFFASHPETAPFLAWVKTAKPSASFASETYNSVNAFYLVNAAGQRQAVRWAVVPAPGQAVSEVGQGADVLQPDLARRLAEGPLRWELRVTLAEPNDPVDDASKQWPSERRTVTAGTLVLDSSQAQSDGACRDINYDPLVLPNGIQASADPLLAARSAAYANSYVRRTGEESHAQQEPRP